jgi:hypothetical protein
MADNLQNIPMPDLTVPPDNALLAQAQASNIALQAQAQAQAQAATVDPAYVGALPFPPPSPEVNVAGLPPLKRAILEMANTHQATQNILQNMTQILGQLTVGPNAAPSTDWTGPPPTLSGKKVSVANPQHFNGDPRNFETFITSIDIVFMANPYTYATHTTKIYYVLSYMTKKFAAQWAQRMVHSINVGSYIITTWEDFCEHLKNTFENADRRNQAQQKLLALRQGALTAEEFFIQFDEYYLESGFNEVAAIHYIKQAVRDGLIMCITTSPSPPETYDEWKTMIIRLDRQFHQNNARQQAFPSTVPLAVPNSLPRSRSTSPAMSSAASNAPTPELSPNITTTSGVQPGISAPMQIDAVSTSTSLANIRCYNCNTMGHYGYQCPHPDSQPNRQTNAPSKRAATTSQNIRQMIAGLGDHEKEHVIRALQETHIIEELQMRITLRIFGT